MDRFRRGVPGSKAYPQGIAPKYRLADCDVIVEPFDAGPRDAGLVGRSRLSISRTALLPSVCSFSVLLSTAMQQTGLRSCSRMVVSPWLTVICASGGDV